MKNITNNSKLENYLLKQNTKLEIKKDTRGNNIYFLDNIKLYDKLYKYLNKYYKDMYNIDFRASYTWLCIMVK